MITWIKDRMGRKAGWTKRRMFVLVSLLLSAGLIIVQRLSVDSRYQAIGLLSVMAYSLSGWSLRKDLRGWGWVVDLILPTLFPTAVGLFYFLLPQAWAVRMVVVGVFTVSMYALLLTVNIFAVASARTIQLLRAARAVGFLLSIVTAALLFHVILSLHLTVGWVGLGVFGVAILILWQGVWSYVATSSVKREFYYALVGACVLAEMVVALAFWSIDVPMASVMLTMGMYVVLGLFQHDLEGRLFQRTISEYLGFAGIVMVVVTMAVMWRWMR